MKFEARPEDRFRRQELNMRIDELDKRWVEAQRLPVIEGKVHELESRG
jgi:hypothetical protein